MRQIVESLWRLYRKQSVTKEQILAMKISEEEKSYILGLDEEKDPIKREILTDLPS